MILLFIIYLLIAIVFGIIAYTNDYDEAKWRDVAIFLAIVWPLTLVIFLLYIAIDTVKEYMLW